MKKTLLVSPFPPYIGGVSVSSQRLYERLLADGYAVEKYSTRYNTRWLNKYRALKLLRHLVLPFYLLSRKRYDVIHFHISGAFLRQYISKYRFLFSPDTKFISTLHGDAFNLIDERLGKNCCSGFDTVICVKKGDTKVLKEYYSGNIVEIPAFIQPVITPDYEKLIPTKVFSFIKRDEKDLLTITGGIICNDNYNDLYGILDALKAFLEIERKRSDIKLLILILGTPTNKKEEELLLKIIEASKKPSILIHKVNGTELWPILKKTSVFLRPTKTDGDALSLREALLFNVPTVASDVVYRPEGTILYNSTTINSLESAISKALAHKNVIVKETKSNFNSIINVYNELCS